jgi:hypothetical protein
MLPGEAGPIPRGERFHREAQTSALKGNAFTPNADVFAPFGGGRSFDVVPYEHGPGKAEFHARLQATYGGS